jgi:hypothetical protein
VPSTDPVIERIAEYPWPHGGVTVRKIRGGYSLLSIGTGKTCRPAQANATSGPFRGVVVAPQRMGSSRPFRCRL